MDTFSAEFLYLCIHTLTSFFLCIFLCICVHDTLVNLVCFTCVKLVYETGVAKWPCCFFRTCSSPSVDGEMFQASNEMTCLQLCFRKPFEISLITIRGLKYFYNLSLF